MKIKADYSNDPVWKELSIKSRLPEELKCLDELAHNMWWAWNYGHATCGRASTKRFTRKWDTTP